MRISSDPPAPRNLLDWGEPPWRIDFEPPASPLPERVDVAIAGGGFTGLAAAYVAARKGLRTAVFEARAIGAGASGRTGGIVLEGTASGPLEEVENSIADLARLTAEARIDCSLRLGGCWEIAHRRRGDERGFAWRDGESHLFVAGRVPGGTVDPGALVAGLARAAVEAGASIHERASVEEIVLGKPVDLRVGGRLVEAGHVILGINAYTGALLPLAGRLHSALTFALATEPLHAEEIEAIGLASRAPFYTTDLPYLWGRITGDDRLVVGAGLAFAEEGDLARLTIARGEPLAALERLERRMRGFHPRLSEVRVAYRWGGPVAFTEDHLPLLARHPRAQSVIAAGGYAGHGVALGVRAGELAALAVADGRELPEWGARLWTGAR